MYKLIVFDLDDVLITRSQHAGELIGKKRIIVHYDVVDLLVRLLDKYQVGIWTSMTEKNAKPIIRKILNGNQKRLLFQWFRDRTAFDPDDTGYKTVKNIARIVENPDINSARDLTTENILLVDNDPDKMRFNCLNSRHIWKSVIDLEGVLCMNEIAKLNLYEWIDTDDYWIYEAPQGTKEWLEVRKGRPSGSIIGAILGHSKFSTPDEVFEQLVSGKEKEFSPEARARMDHGHRFEPVAREWYEKKYNVKVMEVGLIVPKSNPYVGVSVDGMVGEDGLIEIKCPQKMYSSGFIFPTYYDQMQMGMWVTGRKWCDFIVYSTNDSKIFVRRVKWNENYWEKQLDILGEFLEKLKQNLPTGLPIMP